MRILGIDPGERRIGLAISDPLGITAQGLQTFDRRVQNDFVQFVSDLVHDYGVEEIVIGNPLMLSGDESESSRMAERLGEELRRKLRLKVILWDERLTSEQAKRVLKGSRAGKEAVDKVSAAIILQSYLDYLRGREETD